MPSLLVCIKDKCVRACVCLGAHVHVHTRTICLGCAAYMQVSVCIWYRPSLQNMKTGEIPAAVVERLMTPSWKLQCSFVWQQVMFMLQESAFLGVTMWLFYLALLKKGWHQEVIELLYPGQQRKRGTTVATAVVFMSMWKCVRTWVFKPMMEVRLRSPPIQDQHGFEASDKTPWRGTARYWIGCKSTAEALRWSMSVLNIIFACDCIFAQSNCTSNPICKCSRWFVLYYESPPPTPCPDLI